MDLESQIRQLYGQLGEWDAAGVDRVAELAALLRDAGIQELGQIAVNPAQYEEVRGRRGFGVGETASQPTFEADPNGPDTDRILRNAGSWSMGGQNLGFLGNVNRDGSMGANRSGAFQFVEDNPMIGWSARGKGNVAYRLMQQPDGSYGIAPVWGSSSDMGEVRNVAKLAAAMAAMAGGAGLLGGAGGGAGSGGLGLSSGFADAAGTALNGIGGTGGLASGGFGGAMGLTGTTTLPGAAAAAGGAAGGLAGASGGGLPFGLGDYGSLMGGALDQAVAPSIGGSLGLSGSATPKMFDMLKNGASAVNKALGGNLGGLIGAVGGALSSKDQTATSGRDPWGPAQPWIKDMIEQGSALQKQYAANPFSSTQQGAYQNLFGLLNQFNGQMAPSLLANINAMRPAGGTPIQAPTMGLLSPTFRVGG